MYNLSLTSSAQSLNEQFKSLKQSVRLFIYSKIRTYNSACRRLRHQLTLIRGELEGGKGQKFCTPVQCRNLDINKHFCTRKHRKSRCRFACPARVHSFYFSCEFLKVSIVFIGILFTCHCTTSVELRASKYYSSESRTPKAGSVFIVPCVTKL